MSEPTVSGSAVSGPTTDRVVPFVAGDGLRLKLTNVRGQGAPTRGPVLLVHGAGVRANIFRAPVGTTIVDALVAEGHDVWLEDWRASVDVAPNRWTLDQAARFDHPAAVRAVLAETGARRLKAIVHCQGSTSFTMSAIAGLVPEVDTIVTNAVTLHPVVPVWSRAKLRYAVPLMSRLLEFLDPSWGQQPPHHLVPRLLTALVRTGHHECHNTVCKLVSFTYGSGFPALWRHENLNESTHDIFVGREFGTVPLSFFRQMARCVRLGHLVAVEEFPGLPEDYLAAEPMTDARFILLAGERNRCFLPESQRRSYEHLSRRRPGVHRLHVVPGYGHLDVFIGRAAARDVFPLILRELAASPHA